LPAGTSLLDAIARMLAVPVQNRDRQGAEHYQPVGPRVHADWIQIREKDLPARELWSLLLSVRSLPNPRGVKLLVNTRIDVALAASAAGAHLPSGSPAPSHWRAIAPPGFLLGVSCHSVDEVRTAESEGADYVLFGPVFDPISKPPDLPARGLKELSRTAAAVKIPVLALGGITTANAEQCAAAGAAGVAGISLGISLLGSC
jgi:thiamine-phosphate pyrophosphorylase